MNGNGVLKIAVIGLVAVAILALLGGSVLVGLGKALPDALIASGSAAVGALSTLLAKEHNQ